MKEKIAIVLQQVMDKHVSPDTLTDTTDLVSTFGFHSLDMIQFVLKMEDVFNIEVDIENFDVQYFRNLGSLIAFLKTCPVRT